MFQQIPIILASKSPRRQELLSQMGYQFSLVLKEVDESFPANLSPIETALFIANKKINAFEHSITNELVITADTIVVLENEILGKPANRQDAIEMLQKLSGKKHHVITAVCLLHQHNIKSFFDTSAVFFATLSQSEIEFYVDNFKPYDKAGAYGIQEWIGINKIEKIEGSYTNIVGLPTEKLYKELASLI